MHPDQFTPDSHRTQEPDSKAENQAPPPAVSPEQDQEISGRGATAGGTEVRTPDTEGGRHAEAGNAYMGRQMDDDLKTNPRGEDAGTSQRQHPDEPAEGARDAG